MPDPHIASQTYKRNQVEWALWRVHRRMGQRRQVPTARFRTRIKRLLEIDRAEPYRERQEVPGPAFAFSDERTEGRGRDVQFTAFDALCLTTGLDLLNLGLPQADAVFLIRNIREVLRETFHGDLANGPPRDDRQLLAPEQYPDLPTYTSGGSEWVDPSVFLMIRRIELVETLPDPSTKSLSGTPVFLDPVICHGADALANELRDLGIKGRSCLVVEIGYSASAVIVLLKSAPLRTRGPG
jgi:hypothetical protein